MSKKASAEKPAVATDARDTLPSAREKLVSLAVHVLVPMLLAYPALAGNFLINPRSDQYTAGFSFREFARSYFAEHGSIPQWNPYLYGGMPFVDAMHGDTFYPTAWLRLFLGTGEGMTWGMILHVMLAGWFAFLFFRSLGLSFMPALIGGIAYQIGGNLAGLVSPGHDGKMFVGAMFPLGLLLVTRGVRDGKRWTWGALAVVIALQVLSPHPQLLQYSLLITGSYAVFLALGKGSEESIPRAIGLRRLGYALGSVALGMIMGAIQYWPVRHYVNWSPRAGGAGWDHAVSYSMPPEEVINFALPEFSGLLENYWGRNNIHYHSEYVGVIVLVLAGLAFGKWASAVRRRLVLFWGITASVALIWAFGGYFPLFYRIIYEIVPGTKFFRAPSIMLLFVSFTIATLAAFGVQRLLTRETRQRYVLGAAGAIVLLGILGLSGALTNLGVAIGGPERGEVGRMMAGDLRVGAIRMLLVGLAGCAVIYGFMRGMLPRTVALWVLAGLVAADLWSVERRYWQFMPPASVTFSSDATIEYLQSQPGPFRVLAFKGGTGPNGRDTYLVKAGLMAHGIQNVLGYHGNELGNYQELAGGPRYENATNRNFLELANTRYILTDVASLGIEGSAVVAGPVRNAAGNDVYLHTLPWQTSYAWVTPTIVKAPDEQVLATLLNPRFNVRSAALFDSLAPVQSENVQTAPEPIDIETRVTQYGPGFATIELATPAPAKSALVVSENYYPGWTATVDGKPAPIGRADYTFIGVGLPEGAQRVELKFDNAPYRTGRAVTLIALVAALLIWVVGVIAERRRGTGV